MTIAHKLTGNFVETRVDDEILIVDLDGGELLSLEGTARAVWELIDETRTVEAIVTELEQQYDAPRSRIEADVARLMHELEAAKLVVRD